MASLFVDGVVSYYSRARLVVVVVTDTVVSVACVVKVKVVELGSVSW